eukprot:TRINITY_DN1222_c2_g1_i1.p1 TRINITY_DN1222_c2_g1~~TRINITY_DN1222_c2_g1_i1.p1  ORF type:complete len:370 (+),score=133.09 TRINITY_DN1222_c2_g1_i1:146-1111(+)
MSDSESGEVPKSLRTSKKFAPTSEKRERHKPAPVYSTHVVKKKVETKPGNGVPLGDIPNVGHLLAKQKNADAALTNLNKLLYGVGKVADRKKKIRAWSGVPDEDVALTRPRWEAKCAKMKMSDIKEICRVCDLATAGNKDGVVERLLDFLVKPCLSDNPSLVEKETALKEKKVRKRTNLLKKKERKSDLRAKSQKKKEVALTKKEKAATGKVKPAKKKAAAPKKVEEDSSDISSDSSDSDSDSDSDEAEAKPMAVVEEEDVNDDPLATKIKTTVNAYLKSNDIDDVTFRLLFDHTISVLGEEVALANKARIKSIMLQELSV